MRILDPVACPFPMDLLTKPVVFDGIPTTEAEIARCLSARRFVPERRAARLSVAGIAASTALPDARRPAHSVRHRHHIELLVAGRRVHVEAIEQELATPGGTNKEVRAYVDGRLEGRSIVLGRLGATVNTFPLVARVNPGVVVVVLPVQWSSVKELVIEIREEER